MEIRTSEQIDKLSPAMLAAQMKIENADIDSANPHFRSKYASLNSVLDACKKPLNESGIFFIQAPVALDCNDCLGMVTRLTHAESGQWLEATMKMPLQKIDPQGMGSAITYARRYSLMAILGMAAEDDDAEAAMNRPQQSAPKPASQPARQAPKPANQPSASDDGLPAIDGVRYVNEKLNYLDCIVATGKGVYPNKDRLKAAGFKYDSATKKWYIVAAGKSEAPAYDEPPPYTDEDVCLF